MDTKMKGILKTDQGEYFFGTIADRSPTNTIILTDVRQIATDGIGVTLFKLATYGKGSAGISIPMSRFIYSGRFQFVALKAHAIKTFEDG